MPASTTNMRVRPDTHSALKTIAEKCGVSMQDLLDKLVEDHERQVFLNELDSAFSALRSDPDAWKDYQRERAEWDSTLADSAFS
jgi:hypothetical protein